MFQDELGCQYDFIMMLIKILCHFDKRDVEDRKSVFRHRLRSSSLISAIRIGI